jgi:hypothetical protein
MSRDLLFEFSFHRILCGASWLMKLDPHLKRPLTLRARCEIN